MIIVSETLLILTKINNVDRTEVALCVVLVGARTAWQLVQQNVETAIITVNL